MSNTDTTDHTFTSSEAEKIAAIVTRRLALLMPKLVNEAITEVLDVSLGGSVIERTGARIVRCLETAPTLAAKYPAEARFLVNHAMTKTTLRRVVSNSAKGFNDALDALVKKGTVRCIQAVSAKDRLLHVYGLAPKDKGKPAD